MLDAILLSDLHLGATSCQVRAIQQFLDELPSTARLILNGDVVESTESRLTRQHWRVLSRLASFPTNWSWSGSAATTTATRSLLLT